MKLDFWGMRRSPPGTSRALEAVSLYDNFEDYVEGALAERGEE